MVVRGLEWEEADLCAIRLDTAESLLRRNELSDVSSCEDAVAATAPEGDGELQSLEAGTTNELSVYTIDVFEEGSGPESPQEMSYNCPV